MKINNKIYEILFDTLDYSENDVETAYTAVENYFGLDYQSLGDGQNQRIISKLYNYKQFFKTLFKHSFDGDLTIIVMIFDVNNRKKKFLLYLFTFLKKAKHRYAIFKDGKTVVLSAASFRDIIIKVFSNFVKAFMIKTVFSVCLIIFFPLFIIRGKE